MSLGGFRRSPGTLIVIVSVVVVLVLYMGLWRWIWFDELLHFAMGGMTFEYAIKTIDYTTIEVNHGQTGVYLLLDWLLLQATGASAIALRLPSLVSAGFMLASGALFIRAKGFGWRWQAVSAVAFGANSTLMFFAGEARPYMPMAASAIAMLSYYALPRDERRSWWGRLIGAFGFLFGAAIHPYWILLWILVAGFSTCLSLAVDPNSRRPARIWAFLNPWFVVPALVLYVVIGQFTWMRRVTSFGADTSSIYNWKAIITHFTWDHFAFVPYYMPVRLSTGPLEVSRWVMVTIVVVILISLAYVVLDRRCRNMRLLPPTLLLVVGIGSSLVVTYQSYRLAYWIIERQWVGGMAIATLALTWFFAEWWRGTQGRARRIRVPVFVYLTLLTLAFAVSAGTQVQHTVERAVAWQAVEQDPRTLEQLVADPGQQTYTYDPTVGYEYMANLNVARGGPVWEEFVGWYNKWAGMRPEFREDNPGWSRFIWPEPAPQQGLCIPQLCPS